MSAERSLEIRSVAQLRTHLATHGSLAGHLVHDVDLTDVDELQTVDVAESVFLGCTFRDGAQRTSVEDRGAIVFPTLRDLPFRPYRSSLYTADELLDGYEEGGYTSTSDFRIYTHFDRARNRPRGPSLRVSLAQRLHDHAIDYALQTFVDEHGGQTIVGIMGGHSTARTDAYYRKVAHLCRRLTREGYLIATGGGPGIMEAGNLGAYSANFEDDGVVDATIEILADAPEFDGGEREGTPAYLQAIREYLAAAQRARAALHSDEFARRFGRSGDPGESLAVPTWFYGHEPTNLFCDHVAKYFSNGLREDILLAISRGGVVFAPGSAGTLQEVFMDLAQNHYATFVDRSPMIFLGADVFRGVYDLVTEFIESKGMNGSYGDLVGLFDEPDEVVEFIAANPPRPRDKRPALYDLL